MGIATVNTLAELAATREAKISIQPSSIGGNSPAPNGGISVADAVVAMIQVAARESIEFHGSRIRIQTLDLTAVYTVNINGAPAVFDAGAAAVTTGAEIISGLVNAINLAALNASALAEARSGTELDTIVLRNNTVAESATHTTAVSATGTGVLEFDEDLASFDFRLLIQPKVNSDDDVLIPSAGLPFTLVNGGEFTGLNYRGFAETIEVSLWSRIYIQTFNEVSPTIANGKALISIGPGVLE